MCSAPCPALLPVVILTCIKKAQTAAHRANHVFDAVPVLEVLVNKRREGQELTRAGIKVEVVFCCVEAGLLSLPPVALELQKLSGDFVAA